ncbi:MAG: hypothetical protein OT477_05550 [Chloroflexi bacterium]|nr:hypothetical protein [Chloroflexota bacterium]
MAQRADFVIIQEGRATAFYENWGGLGCLYAFAAGPKATVEFTSNMEKINELDGVFAEGGYLIDFDQNIAIVFGYPFDDDDLDENAKQINFALREGELEYLKHIANVWSTWKLIWDYNGIESFINHLKSRGITDIGILPRSISSDIPPISFQA